MQLEELIPLAVVTLFTQSTKKCICIDHYKPDKFEFLVQKGENDEPVAPFKDTHINDQKLVEAEDLKHAAKPRSPGHVTVVGSQRISKMFQ